MRYFHLIAFIPKIIFLIYFLFPNSLFSEEELSIPKPSVNGFFTDEMKYKIQDYANYELKSTGIPALCIVLVEGQEVKLMHYANSPGYESMIGKLFNLGTISRQLTILAAYKLRDESKLNFESRLLDHLPSIKIGRDRKEETILIKHLLDSSTGLRASHERILHGNNGLVYVTTKELLPHFTDIDYYNAPGTLYIDSNFNYILLGEVVAKVSGQTLERHMKDNFFLPLGMERTHYDGIKYNKEGVSVYDYFFSTRRKINPLESPPSFKASQRLFSSADDLARYISFQLKAMNPEIFSHVTISETHKPRIFTKQNENLQYGDGWFHRNHAGLNILYYHSRGYGTSGAIYLLPDKNLGFAVFMNIDATPLNEDMAEGILAILLGVAPEHLSIAKEKVITLFSFALFIFSLVYIISGAYKLDRFFSMIPSEISDSPNLSRNFAITLGIFLFLFWFLFVYFPGSILGEGYTTLPYASALFGWKTDLLYGLLSCLLASFIWGVYLGLSILRDTESADV